MPDIYQYFDRVVVINLKRRTDRLELLNHEMNDKCWPFYQPLIFPAIDGNKVPCPHGWKTGGGSWGCLKSHLNIIEQALIDGTNRLLVLEDDIVLVKDFSTEVQTFLENVPSDWDQLMLGGQHMGGVQPINPYVERCLNCQRTHAYALTPVMMRELYRCWTASKVHCDWVMGPLQADYRVYAPKRFLIGQTRSRSDINGRTNPAKFWIKPLGLEPVILLKCDRKIVDALRTLGVHTGYDREAKTGIDVGLLSVVKREKSLRQWIEELMWEVVSEENYVLGVWHPEITVERLREVWSGPIHLLEASTMTEAVLKLEKIRGAFNAT